MHACSLVRIRTVPNEPDRPTIGGLIKAGVTGGLIKAGVTGLQDSCYAGALHLMACQLFELDML